MDAERSLEVKLDMDFKSADFDALKKAVNDAVEKLGIKADNVTFREGSIIVVIQFEKPVGACCLVCWLEWGFSSAPYSLPDSMLTPLIAFAV